MSEKLHTAAALTNSSSYFNRFFSTNGNSYNLKISEVVTLQLLLYKNSFANVLKLEQIKLGLQYFKIVRFVILILKIRFSPRKTLSPNVS